MNLRKGDVILAKFTVTENSSPNYTLIHVYDGINDCFLPQSCIHSLLKPTSILEVGDKVMLYDSRESPGYIIISMLSHLEDHCVIESIQHKTRHIVLKSDLKRII